MLKTVPNLLSVFVLLIVALACVTPGVTTPDPNFINTAIAQTYAVAASQTAQFLVPVTGSESPTPTRTSSATPFPTYTLVVLDTPEIRVSVNTNCRTGPGNVYDRVGVLEVGEVAQVVGRSADGNYWAILNPDRPGEVCWISDEDATLTGFTNLLPVFTPPPTPTSTRTPIPPTSTRTRTPVPTSPPARTPTWTSAPPVPPTVSSTFTFTPTGVPSLSPTAPSTFTLTPTGLSSPSPTASSTSTPTPTDLSSPTASSTSTPTPSATPTDLSSPTPTASSTLTFTPTDLSSPTASSTSTPTPSATPTDLSSPSPTASSTLTFTPTGLSSPSPTTSSTSTPTPSITPTGLSSPSPTASSTLTSTLSPTPTGTSTPSQTPTASSTSTPTRTSTPTPSVTGTLTPAFTASYSGMESCPGTGWWVEFQVNNTGAASFDFMALIVTDTDTGTIRPLYSPVFINRNGCSTATTEDTFSPGATHTVSSAVFTYNLTGHRLNARLILCASPGPTGICITQTIDFTP